MSSTRIKEKLSSLVTSQLPEFIQSDYTTFVAFLEAYYEFLEQDQNAQELLQNARSYNDVDRTINSFVEYFQQQYCNDIPRDALADKKTLIKNIQDLYNNRGNTKSYKLLFKILFNKDVEIFYPSTQVLKASDGKWVQNYSIFVRLISGNPNDLIQKTTLIFSDSTQYPLLIKKVRKAITTQGSTANLYECFIDNSKNIPVEVGNYIEYGNFRGEIIGIPTSVEIIKPGTGFKVGDILPLTAGQGNYARVKITKINNTGGIAGAQFINFGAGYTENFYNFFSSATGTPTVSSFEFDAPGGTVNITDTTNGFIERGAFTIPSYAVSGFFAEDYDGSIIREFFTSTDISSVSGTNQDLGSLSVSVGDEKDAVLYIKIGTKAKYPGYYESIDGFLSDNIYLESEEYYQPFTYVIKLDERIDAYRKAVLDILHPAGTKLLGELTLGTSVDLSATITATIRFLISRFQSEAGAKDDGNAKNIIKPVDDPSTGTGEFIAKDILKPREDSIDQILDNTAYLLAKPLAHEVGLLNPDNKDYSKVVGLGENLPYAESYFAEDYVELSGVNFIVILDTLFEAVLGRELFDSVISVETSNISYQSNITDATVSAVDDGISKSTSKNLSDTAGVLKSDFDISGSVNYFTDTQIASDISIAAYSDKYTEIELITDSGTVFTTDYADFTYFAEDYVGTTLHTF